MEACLNVIENFIKLCSKEISVLLILILFIIIYLKPFLK